MNRPTPIATLSLFIRTAFLRLANRSAFLMAKAKSRRAPEQRSATQHRTVKRGRGRWMTWFVLGSMVFGWTMFASNFIGAIVDTARLREIEANSTVVVSPEEFARFQKASNIEDAADRERELTSTVSSIFGSPVGWLDTGLKDVVHARLKQDGLQAFTVAEPTKPWRGTIALLSPADRNETFAAVGLYLFTAFLSLTLTSVGMMSKQLTQADPSLGWLLQFPVSRHVLIVAKLAERFVETSSAVIGGLVAGLTAWMSGFNFSEGFLLVVVTGLSVGLSTAAIQVIAEIGLFQCFGRKVRGGIVGAASIVGGLGMFFAMFGYNAPPAVEALRTTGRVLPAWFYWNPLSQGFGTVAQRNGGAAWTFVAPVLSVVACLVVIELCVRLIAGGFSGGQESARGATMRIVKKSQPRFGGVIGKELLQIRRQPEQMAQIIFAPLLVAVLLYFSGQGKFAAYAVQNAGAVCASTFVGACYLLLVAVNRTLTDELKTVWFLQCLPRSLGECIRAKSRVWAGIAVVMLVGVLGGYVAWHPAAANDVALRAPFAVLAVWLLSELIFGFTSLAATIVNDQNVQFRRSAVLLPMLLVGNCIPSMYTGNLWDQFVLIVVLSIAVLAVRQKQEVELKWLTEPAEDPPQRLYALHGLVTIALFLFVRDAVKPIFIAAELPAAEVLAYAFTGAALIVAVGSWIWMKCRRLHVSAEARDGSVLKLIAVGLASTCFVGFAWDRVLSVSLPVGGHGGVSLSWQPDSAGSYRSVISFLAMVVLIAPVFEEWLFRGVLFRSLRCSTGALTSIVITGLLFAAIHPITSFPPVLVLGLAAAWIVERSGRVWPATLVHVGYNLFVVVLWNVAG